MKELQATQLIRAIPDFPEPGILFRDITPVLQDPVAFHEVVLLMADFARSCGADVIAGIESRGFIFGVALAQELKLGFLPIRKKGKLPWTTVAQEYKLEYGVAEIEMHTDAVQPGQKVLIVDDLLATGGTAQAAVNLVKMVGGEVAGLAFMIELDFLAGRKQLEGHEICSLIHY